MTKDTFRKQIRIIRKTHTAASLDQVVKYLNGDIKISSPIFVITFDDGYKDNLAVVDICQQYHIQPTLYVLGESQNSNRKTLANSLPLLDVADLKKLVKLKWEIGSHTKRHTVLTDVSSIEMNAEIVESKKTIETKIGQPILSFSYPKGRYDKNTITAVQQAGYTHAVSMDDGIITNRTNPFVLYRVGVDGSHSMAEFPYLWSPSVVAFRSIVKETFLGRYL